MLNYERRASATRNFDASGSGLTRARDDELSRVGRVRDE